MTKKRTKYKEEFKFRVALEAAKGNETINEIAGRYSVHPNQVRNWKGKLMEGGKQLFERGRDQKKAEEEGKENELYEQIGRLKMELEWVKKKAEQFV